MCLKGSLYDIRDLAKKLSDFESSSSSSDEDPFPAEAGTDQKGGYQTVNSKSRARKEKRKASRTPEKDYFMKKQNRSSPVKTYKLE